MGYMRSQSKKKYLNFKKPIWKVLDDYTGAYIYSNEAEIDYKGLITRQGHADQKPLAECPIIFSTEEDNIFRRDDI